MNEQPSTLPDFEALSAEEKISYVQDLWDRIAAQPDQIPLSDTHRRILDERLAAYEANPDAGRPWEEVRDEILSKL